MNPMRLLTAALLLALGACTRNLTAGDPTLGGGGGPIVPEGSPLVTSPVFVTPVPTPLPAANVVVSPGPVPVVIISPAVGPLPSPSPIGTIAPLFPSPRAS